MSSLPGGEGNGSSNADSSQEGSSGKRRKSKTKRAELAAKDSEEVARVALEEAQRTLAAASERREKATAARKRAKEQSEAQKAANAAAQTPTPAESGAEAMEVETPDPTPAKPKKGKVAEKSATTPSPGAVDKLAASATPPVGIKIPMKVVVARATESTLAPTSAIEPSVTEATAIESAGARPKEVSGTEDLQAWEVVTRRVRDRRALPDTRPLRDLKSYKQGSRVMLPPLTGADGSDDEEWFEDDVHPIDWYVQLIEAVVSATDGSGIPVDERLRIGYAWSVFNPGNTCCFDGCAPAGTTPRRFATDGRYARHLVEQHRAIRPSFGCTLKKGQFPCTMVTGEPGGPFRCLRRGLMVRHLRDNHQPHRYSAETAMTVVKGLVAGKKDTSATGGKFFMVWQDRTKVNSRRLFIKDQKVWAAFLSRNPKYREVLRTKAVDRAKAKKQSEDKKRSHSVDSSGAAAKKVRQSSLTGGTLPRERSPPAPGTSGSGGRKEGRSRSRQRKAPSAAAGSAGSLAPGAASYADVTTGNMPPPREPEHDPENESTSEPAFGEGLTSGMPDMGFLASCRGLLEMTGNQPLDDFGRSFREEANAFMFALLVRANTCLRDVTLPAMTLVAREGVTKATSDRLTEMEERLGHLQVNHDFEVKDLGDRLREYRDIDRDFHATYGCSLRDWSRENRDGQRVLTPREVNPTRQMRDYVVDGVSATGGIPRSQDLRLRDNSNLGMSPSIRRLDQAMGQLGHQCPSPEPLPDQRVLTPGRHFGASVYHPSLPCHTSSRLASRLR